VSRSRKTARRNTPPARGPVEPRAAAPVATRSTPGGWSLGTVPMSSPTEGTERAPAVVHEVVGSPGESLEPETRKSMEASLGADFGGVRIHRDDRAARSADAVGAAAYTVGDHVAFNRGLYRPETAAGRKLLEHELAHVAEEGGATVPSALHVGRDTDPAERVADARSSRPHTTPGAARPGRARTAVLRRTTLGSLLGAGLGAVGGALIGGLLGGPIGAIVGGVIGLVGGAIAGELATTRSRSLTAEEIRYAREIYLDSIDYSKITITRDSVLALGAPRTIGNTIHLKSDWGAFVGDTLELTEQGKVTLIHEMGHVWQYQNGGLAYMPQSIIAQLRATVSGGNRNAAYDWRAAHRAGIPWEEWNPEQQAEAIEDYNVLLRKQQAGTATTAELHELSVLLPYIERVRRREGAPTFFGGRRSSPSPAGSPPPSGSSSPSGGGP
jgi:Domain of unknown function (DUF4157)